MLARVLEPEVMNTVEEAVDYDQMDHRQVNRIFVDDFLSAIAELVPERFGCWHVFDAGTGTAQIPIELLQRQFSATVTASDLADQMLIVAKQNVAAAGFENSIELVLRDCKRLPDADASYDAVISNSIVHHIPTPHDVFVELWRILKPGGVFFLRDLMRPNDVAALERVVSTYAADANDHQQQMFRDSLHAALDITEVRCLVRELGLPDDVVQATSDRHWTVKCLKAR